MRQLPAKHVDTGMGLERVTSILQNKMSNYDTDAFMPLFERISEITGVRKYTGKVGKDDVDGIDMAYRVTADHARTLTIAIADGEVPSNEQRGYVLRRILRRGVRYARHKLNAELGTFYPRLIDTVAQTLGDAYPEVYKRLDFIKDVLGEEERGFAKTLGRGEKMFETALAKAKLNGNVFPGFVAHQLYDTYGFPIDLTRLMAAESGVKVDE